MEVSGLNLNQTQTFFGELTKTHFSKPRVSCGSIELRSSSFGINGGHQLQKGFKALSMKASSSGFSDNGHVEYYETKKKEKKVVVKEKEKKTKKKVKVIQGLMKNLSMVSEMGSTISEARELLLVELQQLRAQEKEMKRKRKDEKAKMKLVKGKLESSSSSSSSSSSDSECGGGEVIDMRTLRASSTLDQEKVSTSQLEEQEEEMKVVLTRSAAQERCGDTSTSGGGMRVNVEACSDRIDVCMGGKCKKLGAPALLEELKERVGMDGVVVGCKCMGKCRSAPNVRVSNQALSQGVVDDSEVRVSSNPLYIGVGLDDVSAIVANFLGDERRIGDMGLMGA